MTDAQMIYQVRLGYDAFYSAAAPGFTDNEIASVLNKAQDQFIQSNVDSGDFSFIKALVNSTSGTLSTSTLVTTNNASVYTAGNIPTDLSQLISAEALIARSSISNPSGMFPEISSNNTSWTICNSATLTSSIYNFIDSISNSTSIFLNPMMFSASGLFTLITDKYSRAASTAPNFKVLYIKQRADITTGAIISCQIEPIKHRVIVDLGINILKEYVGYNNKDK